MKVHICIFLFVFVACSNSNTTNTVDVHTITTESNSSIPLISNKEKEDTIVSFEKFVTLFKQASIPLKASELNNKSYLIKPFSADIKYLNGLKIVDFQKAPTSTVPCFYGNDCSASLPPDLKNFYDDGELATKFYGLELLPRKGSLIVLLCLGRAVDGTEGDSYLLVYNKDGTFLSGIQTNANCGNKVASFNRSSTINKDWSISIKDYQEFANQVECSTNKGFEVNYVYQVNEKSGIITKKSENVKVF